MKEQWTFSYNHKKKKWAFVEASILCDCVFHYLGLVKINDKVCIA